MPVYQNAEDFYALLRAAFQEMSADPRSLADFQRRRLAVQITTTAPAAVLVIDGRSEPVAFSLGQTAARSDLALTLPADLLHSILLDESSVRTAFTSGQVEVKGNIFRALQLADLFHELQRVYPPLYHRWAEGY
ncbi:MAG: SCP2 sterol-binding domain-containing protein [Caldilineales bacterium]